MPKWIVPFGVMYSGSMTIEAPTREAAAEFIKPFSDDAIKIAHEDLLVRGDLVDLNWHPEDIEEVKDRGGIVYMQLEASHHNADKVAWYVYTSGVHPPTKEQVIDLYNDREKTNLVRGGALGLGKVVSISEAPSPLSQATGLYRWYVWQAG